MRYENLFLAQGKYEAEAVNDIPSKKTEILTVGKFRTPYPILKNMAQRLLTRFPYNV